MNDEIKLKPRDPNFESPYLLLENAKKKFNDLSSCIAEYSNSKPYDDIVEEFPDKHYQIHKLRINSPIPNDARLLTRDIITSLRDALDHAMFSAAQSGGNNNSKYTGFVFSDNEENYIREIEKKHRYKDNPDFLKPLQHYLKAYPDGNPYLCGLNKIRNPNTHRKIVACGSVPSNTVHIIKFARGNKISNWNFETNEYEYFISKIGSKRAHHVDISLDLVFKDTEAFDRQSVLECFGWLGGYVEEIVRLIEDETLNATANQ